MDKITVPIQVQHKVLFTYRPLFEGQNAHVRQSRTIRKILKSGQAPSSSLVRSMGINKVVLMLKMLLEQGVFEQKVLLSSSPPCCTTLG